MDSNLLLEQAPDAIIYADKNGEISYWNEAATRVFGFDASEAMGQNLDIIIPENFRNQHWTGFDRALGEGDTKYRGQALPTKATHKDGRSFYVELSFSIVKDASGTVVGAMAAARDITERFERDRDLRRKLRDLEQRLNPPATATT
jgi:PAS domain S-box-containing protein